MCNEWTETKDELPKAGETLYLKLHAEYTGSWEPEEEGSRKGQWVLDPPVVNTSQWRYLTEEEKEELKEKRKRAKTQQEQAEKESKEK